MEEKLSLNINTKIKTMNPMDLKLLKSNARYMRHEQFQLLVDNVKRDGKLTSVPFGAINEDGTYTVLSGNHRVMAAIEAELDEIEIMVTDDELTEKQRLAIQLSHNSISGQDDPDVLKELYKSLNDVDWQIYSGLDDKSLEMIEAVDALSFSESTLKFRTVTLLFLPEEIEEVESAFKDAKELISTNYWWLANMKQYDDYLDLIRGTQHSTNVSNIATGLMTILEVFKKNVAQLSDEWMPEENFSPSKTVPLISIFGNDTIPSELGRRLNKVTDSMVSKGLIEPFQRHMALDVMIWSWEELNKRG